MASGKSNALWLVVLVCVTAISLNAQSFRVQCPTSTITHPNAANNNSEPLYNGPTTFTTNSQGYVTPATNINGAIKCQQISGGDGYSTMADGTQTYMFSFGPLSGLTDIAAGLRGTQPPTTFNPPYPGATPLVPGDPATTDGATDGATPGVGIGPFAPFQWNGAVGLAPEVVNTVNVSDLLEGPLVAPATIGTGCFTPTAHTVTAYTYEALGQAVGGKVTIAGTGTPYDGTYVVTGACAFVTAPAGFTQFAFQYTDSATGLAELNELTGPTASTPPQIDGHVDPRPIIDRKSVVQGK